MRPWIVFVVAAALCACASVNKTAVGVVADTLSRGEIATLDEPDYYIARDAWPAQINLVETLSAASPQNTALHVLAAKGLGGGSFFFIEDESPARAKALYRRGLDHALKALAPRIDGDPVQMPLADLTHELARLGKDDVPALFWAGFDWAGYVNLSKDDAAALAELPRVAAFMTRVSEIDPGFQFGGADLFFGVYYASRPAILGGDLAKSKAAFERVHKLTKGQYLMAHVLNARWYAVAAQDRALFEQLLRKVIDAPSGEMTGARLSDEVAKRKAAALLKKMDDLF